MYTQQRNINIDFTVRTLPGSEYKPEVLIWRM